MFSTLIRHQVQPLLLTTTTTTTTTMMRTIVSSTSFSAWRVQQLEDGSFQGSEQVMSMEDLVSSKQQQEQDNSNMALIRVTHSSLNYKDALSASGNRGVTKHYPHTPGIDAAGIMVDDDNNNKNTNNTTNVLVTGYDLGMNTDGGFGEYICVPKNWCVPLPAGWTGGRQAMVYGTAGLTAGLCVQKLLTMGAGASPAQGPVAVTGASGAVGSVAVEILSKLGFDVTAVSGKQPSKEEFLRELGAKTIVGREALATTKKPLLKPVFAHAIDTVGGSPLVELLKQVKPGGSVACCGLVAGPQLETTVLPFILRGINLLGVDSVEIPREEKLAVWNKLATEWACPVTEKSARDIGRHELDACLKAFLKGESSGKIVLDHSLTKKSSSL